MEGDSVQVRRMQPVRLHCAVCFQCRERGHLRCDCTASAREPASAHGGEEGHPWLQPDNADFESGTPVPALCYFQKDDAESATADMDSDSDFDFESPANSSSGEDEEGGSVIDEGVALVPPSCRFYAQIGRVCGHCPDCPFAVLKPDSNQDKNDGRRRRAVVPVRVRLTAPRPPRAPPNTPPTPSRSACKGPPRHARYKGAYVQ